jgi:hypothetical protein
MADAFEQSISFTGQKRRVRPVRRVQVSTHFDDLDVKPLDLATPPPPAPEPFILTETASNSDLKLPQVKEAGYATKYDDVPIDEFAFLSGIVPKQKAETAKSSPIIQKESSEPLKPGAINSTATSEALKPNAIIATAADEPKSISQPEPKPEPTREVVPKQTRTLTPPLETVKNPEKAPIIEVKKAPKDTVERSSTAKQEMTEVKKVPIGVSESANPVEGPPLPSNSRQDRRSFVSMDSQTPRMDFNESDAGIMKQRTSKVESDSSDTKRTSLTESACNEYKPDSRESLKPRMLPVLSVAQPAAKCPENFNSSPPIVASNLRPSSVVSNNGKIPLTTDKQGKTTPIKLANYQAESDELGRLRENFDKQAILLEKERKDRLKMEHEYEALKSKCEAQDEALRYKNEKAAKMEQDFIFLKNEVTGLKIERDRIHQKLEVAETELKQENGNNAAKFIAKSDEIIELKVKLDNLACAISDKNQEISALNTQLKASQDTHINVIFDSLNALKDFDEDFIAAVETEILKMETLLKEESEYNVKLQQEVNGEYSFWKKILSSEDP